MQKRLHFRAFLSAAAAVCLLVVTACSGGGNADSTTSTGTNSGEKSAEENIQLTLVIYNYEGARAEKEMADWKELFPNIDVEVKLLPSESEYFTALDVSIAGNEKMDVILLDNDKAAQLGAQGVLVDLNTLAANDNHFDIVENYGTVMEAAQVDGKYYYIPYNIDFDVLYYNKDMFDANGIDYPDETMTLSELAEKAKRLTSGEGANKVYGFVWGYQSYNSLLRFIENDGWEWLKEDGSPNFDDPRVKDVFVTFKDLFDSGAVPSIATMQLEKMNNRLVFAQKKAAMIIRNWWTPVQWNMFRYNDKVIWQDGIDVNIGLDHIPRYEESTQPMMQNIKPGWGFGVSAKTEHPEAAWELVKYMTSTRYELAERLDIIPAYTKISDEKFYTIYNEFQTQDGEVIKNMYPESIAVEHKAIKDELIPTSSQYDIDPVDAGILQALKDVVEREATEYFTGKIDIDTLIGRLQTESEKVISQMQ